MAEDSIKQLIETQAEEYKHQIELLSERYDEREKKMLTEIRDLRTDVQDLQTRLESTQKELVDLRSELPKLKRQIKQLSDYQSSIRILEKRVNHYEENNRRDNLVIDGMPEDDSETAEETQAKVIALLSEKLGLPATTALQARRIGKGSAGKSRAVVVRFTERQDREATLRNASKLEGTNIFINEYFYPTARKQREARLYQLKQGRRPNGSVIAPLPQTTFPPKLDAKTTSPHPPPAPAGRITGSSVEIEQDNDCSEVRYYFLLNSVCCTLTYLTGGVKQVLLF